MAEHGLDVVRAAGERAHHAAHVTTNLMRFVLMSRGFHSNS
jgi:hypothetical protein